MWLIVTLIKAYSPWTVSTKLGMQYFYKILATVDIAQFLFTLGITVNAYMCIELNAHAMTIFLLTLRIFFPESGLLSWLLGSQTCEKAFRAARSLSSVFSTIINFGMLGLLRRLHRMQVQF